MNENQIDYLLALLREKGKKLHEDNRKVLKDKNLGISHVVGIIESMEMNNSVIVNLEKMKKEVGNGLLGLNN